MSNFFRAARKGLGLLCLCASIALGIVAVKAANAPGKPGPAAASSGAEPLTLNKGDHVAILGNALPDRMQFDGYFETLVHAKFPQNELVFRNLCAAGDEV